MRAARMRPSGMTKLNGHWVPAGAELGGEALPMPPVRFIVANESYVVEAETGRDEGVLRFGPGGVAEAVDIVGVGGPNAGRTIEAIFRVVGGDVLELCYDVGGGPRPETFSTAPGEYRLLVRYRRA